MATLRIRLLHRASKNPGKYGKTSPAPVYISLTLQGEKSAMINTGVSVPLSKWDKRTKRVVYHGQMATLNKRISDARYEVEKALKELSAKGDDPTPVKLKAYLDNPVSLTFSSFYREEMEQQKAKVAHGTYLVHLQTIDALDEYQKNVSFETIADPGFIIRFLHELETKRNLKTNSVHKHYKNLRTYINRALIMRYISREDNPIPALRGRFKIEKTKKIYLTEKELTLFENLVLDSSQQHLQKYLNGFLFGCYTGLRIGDLMGLSKKNIEFTDNGMKLHYRAQKTNKENVLPLAKLFPVKGQQLSRPEAIVKEVLNDPKYRIGQRFFQINNVQVMNRALKQLAEIAGLREKICLNITSHCARKTCVNILYRKGADTKLIQAITQHSDERELMSYLDVNADAINTRMDFIDW